MKMELQRLLHPHNLKHMGQAGLSHVLMNQASRYLAHSSARKLQGHCVELKKSWPCIDSSALCMKYVYKFTASTKPHPALKTK